MAGRVYANGWAGAADLNRSRKYFAMAADAGNPDAATRLGLMYATGTGVQQDSREAERWLALGADNGDITAQMALGGLKLLSYIAGARGDAPTLKKYLGMAAAQGDPTAAVQLAGYYLVLGRPIGDVDAPRAVAVLKHCVEVTYDKNCLMAYGQMLAEGKGTGADLATAYAYTILAVCAARRKRWPCRKSSATRMTADEMAEARTLGPALRAQMAHGSRGHAGGNVGGDDEQEPFADLC